MNRPMEQHDAGPVVSGAVAAERSRAGARPRLADVAELAKIRISSLVLVVTAIGFGLGAPQGAVISSVIATLVGVFFVAAAANTLNQLMEREFDRLMPRTMDRPIAAGRVSPNEALILGTASGLIGIVILSLTTTVLATALAVTTIVLYLFAYTPLKRRTVHNTLVGAVPGALPPLIGYAAAAGYLGADAWILFAILFFWQLPHFYAIAWMYREDYRIGGYKMLSVVDPTGRSTRIQAVIYTLILIGASLSPVLVAPTSLTYITGATVLGLGLLAVAIGMFRHLSRSSARAMLLASVIYLPALLSLLLIDRLSG